MADEFTLDVAKFAKDFIEGSEKAIRGTTIKLWSAVIKATPVDSGRARGSWLASGNTIPSKVTVTTDKSGAKTIKDATEVVLGLQDWSVFTLTSNLVYMPNLELGLYNDGPKTINGFSRQAPMGMIRNNIRRFGDILENEARSNLPK